MNMLFYTHLTYLSSPPTPTIASLGQLSANLHKLYQFLIHHTQVKTYANTLLSVVCCACAVNWTEWLSVLHPFLDNDV